MRTDWFRAWAAKTRTDEEINLLYADGRATCRGFRFASTLWRNNANLPRSSPYASADNEVYASAGARAYALQKSTMFRLLADQCLKAVRDAHYVYRETVRKMDVEEGDDFKDIFYQIQEGLVLDDARLDYSLVRGCLLFINSTHHLTICSDTSLYVHSFIRREA